MFHSDPRIDVLMWSVFQDVADGRVEIPTNVQDEIDKQMVTIGLTHIEAEYFVVEEMLHSHWEALLQALQEKHHKQNWMN